MRSSMSCPIHHIFKFLAVSSVRPMYMWYVNADKDSYLKYKKFALFSIILFIMTLASEYVGLNV